MYVTRINLSRVLLAYVIRLGHAQVVTHAFVCRNPMQPAVLGPQSIKHQRWLVPLSQDIHVGWWCVLKNVHAHLQIDGHEHTVDVDWWQLGILLYEMLFGRSPFRGISTERTFHNIRMRRLEFPAQKQPQEQQQQHAFCGLWPAGDACRSILKGLLHRDPSRRLGHSKDGKDGVKELKEHSFWEGICWDTLPLLPAPEIARKVAEESIAQPEHQITDDTPEVDPADDDDISRFFSLKPQ